MELILASHSPRRRELLERMGLRDFRIVAADIDEEMDGDVSPEALVRRLSLGKARAVQAREGLAPIIIAADTVVAIDWAVLGKPRDEADAARMLSALSGRSHQVYTGLAVLLGDTQMVEHEVTEVTFRPMSAEEISYYIKTGEPMDKAGGYGIQGYGALLVEGITGDYYNVMGLPVCRLGKLLTQLGVDCLRCAAGLDDLELRV